MSVVISVISALAKIGSAWAAGGMAQNENLKELGIQKEIVNRKKTELETNYNQSKLDLKNQYDQSKNNLNYNIGYTSMVRGQNAGFASQANVKKTDFMYEDLSMMLDDIVVEQGQAMHSAAQTGFRNTGSQAQALSEIEEAKQYQIDRAVETIKLSAAESYVAASDNYVSATAQIEQYKVNLDNLKVNYDNALQSLKNQYDQNLATLNDTLKEIERQEADAIYTMGEALLDTITLGLAGANDIALSYNQEQLNALQSDFYAEQLAQYDKVDDKNVKRTSGTSISKPTYMQR